MKVYLLFLCQIIFFAGCASVNYQNDKSLSVLDTAELQISEGYKYLDSNSPDGVSKAERCFLRALELDRKNYSAYNGLAESYMQREQFASALQYALLAKEEQNGNDTTAALLSYIRWSLSFDQLDLQTQLQERQQAVNELISMVEKQPASDYLNYYAMILMRNEGNYELAAQYAVRVKSDFKNTVKETRMLSLFLEGLREKPESLKKLTAQNRISRAELSAATSMFFSPLRSFFPPQLERESSENVEVLLSDVDSDYWARPFIEEMLVWREYSDGAELRLMDYTDESVYAFSPHLAATRSDLMYLLQNLLILKTRNPSLVNQFAGSEDKPFYNDIPAYAKEYSPSVLVSKYQLMTTGRDGSFGLAKKITGYELLYAFISLSELVKGK